MAAVSRPRHTRRHGRRKGDGLIDTPTQAVVHLSRAVSGSQPEGAPFMLKVKSPLLGVSFMAFLQLYAGEQPAQEGEPLY